MVNRRHTQLILTPMKSIGITALTCQKLIGKMAHIKLFDEMAFGVFFFNGANGCWRRKHCAHLMLGNNPPEGSRIWRTNWLAFE